MEKINPYAFYQLSGSIYRDSSDSGAAVIDGEISQVREMFFPLWNAEQALEMGLLSGNPVKLDFAKVDSE